MFHMFQINEEFHSDLMRWQRRAIETGPRDSSRTKSNFAKSKEHHLESRGRKNASRSCFQSLSTFTSISLYRTGMAVTSATLFFWCTDLRKSMLTFYGQSVVSDFFPPFHFAMWERGGAGRTIKCTIWCDLGAARKYWWDSWTLDVTHDTVMLVNIGECILK